MAADIQTTPFTILVDDREKGGSNMQHDRMFDFRPYSVPVRRAHLAQGDYSLLGYEGRFAIERKSPKDLVSTLFGFHRAGGKKVSNCERFALELQRLADYEHVYVSITGSEQDVAKAANAHALEVWSRTGGRYKYPPNPEAVFNLVAALSAEFAIPFIMFPDVATAERQALRDFRAWHRQALGLSHVARYSGMHVKPPKTPSVRIRDVPSRSCPTTSAALCDGLPMADSVDCPHGLEAKEVEVEF